MTNEWYISITPPLWPVYIVSIPIISEETSLLMARISASSNHPNECHATLVGTQRGRHAEVCPWMSRKDVPSPS